MLLSESKEIDPIVRFEQLLMLLIERYSDCRHQLTQLAAENKRLKALLQAQLDQQPEETFLSIADHNNLTKQINTYIKEIDRCLAYFEQI